MSLALLPLKLLLLAIDFSITLLTFGWLGIIKKLLNSGTIPLRSKKVGDNESHRVHIAVEDGKFDTSPVEGCTTLYDLSSRSFTKYAKSNCMGSRPFLRWKTKKIKEFAAGTIWRSYMQVGEESHKFGAALCASGLVPAPETTDLNMVKTTCRMAIFENTCAEWMIAAQGAFSQSITVTTIYATLGIDSVVLAINENIIPVILCNKNNVGCLVSKLDEMPTLKTIVYTNDLVAIDDVVEIPTSLPAGVRVVSFEDFVKSGDTAKYSPRPPKATSTAVIMYTSGSTGKPKGVVISHESIVACAAAGHRELKVIEGQDDYLAYLPLAHIMELMAEFCMIAVGCTLCYADPKSLSSTGAYPVGALEHYSPTVLIAVPKIWDTIKKGVESKIAAESAVKQYLVKTAMDAKRFARKHGFDTPLFNKLVFKKFKKAVGGKLRFCVSGGGPLNGEVQSFIQTCFSCSLVQGYGLTETCAGLTFQDDTDERLGVQGVPISSCECKLISTPEICDKAGQPYMSTDKLDVDGTPVFGRGEICVKGGNVSSGYYMMPEATKESWVDGWFHTGDIGQFLLDGSIKLIDRKKNLVKLKGGEYVALESMEMIYGNSSFVDGVNGGICCYGDGDMDRPVALVQLKQDTVKVWAAANGMAGVDYETLKTDLKVYEAVMESMRKEFAKSTLSNIEKIVAVCLLHEHDAWTPENGCLTAANKLQRRAVIQQFENEFIALKPKGIF